MQIVAAEYMNDIKAQSRLTSKQTKLLFQEIEELETLVWCALLGKVTQAQLDGLAEIAACQPNELLGFTLPLDKLGKLINRIHEVLPKKHCSEVYKHWCSLVVIRDRIFTSNLLLVVAIAKKYKNTGEYSTDDIIQEGNTGLMQAIYRFEWRKGFQFSTYATHWIRHAITRALMNNAATIRIPVHVLESTEKRANAPRVTESIDQPVQTAEGDLKRTEILADDFQHPLGMMINRELAEELHEYLDEMDEMHRFILEKRFGFKGDPMTLKEIGDHFGLSRERIRQLEAEAILDLQGRFKR